MVNDLQSSEIPLEYTLNVFTQDTVASYTGYINMDYSSILKKKSIEQPDYTINKYSLVLFDFDSPVITDVNRKVIDKYIIPNIYFGSNIDIYGYSDRIGNPNYNTQLSLQRANAVRDYILTKNRNVPINAYGLGNESEIFDNELPIGRQLSRTVQILVITPK
jgi:outer membrane protein OmpA-like peptidoglycan-associated protein